MARVDTWRGGTPAPAVSSGGLWHTVEPSSVPALLVDGEAFRIQQVNPAFLRRTGLQREALQGHSLLERCAEECVELLRGLLLEVVRTGTVAQRGGVRWQRQQRPPLVATTLASPVVEEAALPAHTLLVQLLVPVHAARGEPGGAALTEDLRRANASLLLAGMREHEAAERASRQALEMGVLLATTRRLAAVVEWASDFIATATPTGAPLFFNAAALRMCGRTAREALETGSLADVVAAEDRQRLREEALPTALVKGRWLGELCVRHCSTGAATPLHCSLFAIRDVMTGEQLGVGMVGRDISDRKRQEAEVRRRAEFEERLIRILSHDLRSPLAAVRLTAEVLLERQAEGDPRTLSLLNHLHTLAARTDRMVTDALDFTLSRTPGGLPLTLARVGFEGVVRRVVEQARALHPARRVRLEEGHVGVGTWDAERLAQALSNLLNRALKESPPESTVTVRTRGAKDWVECEVNDRGPPIPEEQLPDLFEPLHHREPAHRLEGPHLGLGLYLAERIARAHGGSLRVASSAAEGTTFTLHLPREARLPASA